MYINVLYVSQKDLKIYAEIMGRTLKINKYLILKLYSGNISSGMSFYTAITYCEWGLRCSEYKLHLLFKLSNTSVSIYSSSLHISKISVYRYSYQPPYISNNWSRVTNKIVNKKELPISGSCQPVLVSNSKSDFQVPVLLLDLQSLN